MDTPTIDSLFSAMAPAELLPVIIQDARTLQVLMLGHMDREAYSMSLAEGRVCLRNRGAGRPCPVDDGGGSYLEIASATPADDDASLLLRVIPHGEAAAGSFAAAASPDEGFIRLLQSVIQGRHQAMPEGSYTTYLFNKGVNKIAQKVGEEAVETVIEAVAGNHERLIYEASDLIYHLLVLMEATGHSIADLEAELVKRHK